MQVASKGWLHGLSRLTAAHDSGMSHVQPQSMSVETGLETCTTAHRLHCNEITVQCWPGHHQARPGQAGNALATERSRYLQQGKAIKTQQGAVVQERP